MGRQPTPPRPLPPLLPRLRIRQAQGFWARFIGLMGRPDPRAAAARDAGNAARTGGASALLIAHCTSVHTCFMRYALDIIYLDAQGRITRQALALAPWRCSRAGPGAAHVLELPAGAITGLQPGMQLQPWPIDAATANARFVRVADPRGAASAPPAAPIATT
ncbi:DUF192 domain-containing protein [Verminephrobacter eiseniae]|uniref:DUF192 domain-containing protein n=1 Tax=Verminephrobacter eiseniae (strain EF01-2) TaxID=391735 RepID=A1WEI4_VEREI|nr:DUF192 domain-containing protein [Verminephrobacter eiseniae]ABM56041.1 protein of unknown function DUF192 [Verminephrobacter eiseniae EF01-2]MCW5286413.1 DUF192 domain-containing protein [Verminephrobacter eiseniae]MCW5304712.1 DUF192 domain-containing protein [Verminephrobacter eiseniae]MCW8190536.1 DUF192 domain-containing protein [Verminephrobacter eiseniae]